MKKILLISLSLLFAGEMEVDGNLTVTEGVNASSFAGDGSALTNLPSLGGMKPERIYTKNVDWDVSFSATVPNGKFWIVYPSFLWDMDGIIDGQEMGIAFQGKAMAFYVFQSFSFNQSPSGQLSILEYSISGSGTDQGMDYVIP